MAKTVVVNTETLWCFVCGLWSVGARGEDRLCKGQNGYDAMTPLE